MVVLSFFVYFFVSYIFLILFIPKPAKTTLNSLTNKRNHLKILFLYPEIKPFPQINSSEKKSLKCNKKYKQKTEDCENEIAI